MGIYQDTPGKNTPLSNHCASSKYGRYAYKAYLGYGEKRVEHTSWTFHLFQLRHRSCMNFVLSPPRLTCISCWRLGIYIYLLFHSQRSRFLVGSSPSWFYRFASVPNLHFTCKFSKLRSFFFVPWRWFAGIKLFDTPHRLKSAPLEKNYKTHTFVFLLSFLSPLHIWNHHGS